MTGITLWLCCFRQGDPPAGAKQFVTPQGRMVVAFINDSAWVEVVGIVQRILGTNGIRCVIEGSLEQGAEVPIPDAKQAAKLLAAFPELRHRGIRILEP